MLDSIEHMTLNLIKNHIFGVKTTRFCHLLRNVIMDVITCPENLSITSGLSTLFHSVISLPDVMSCHNMYLKILWKMEHLLFWSLCSIFHNIFKSNQNLT